MNTMMEETLDLLAPIGITTVAVFCLYEWLQGKYRNGKKSREDWYMAGICLAALALVQRPLLMFLVFGFMGWLFPQGMGALNWVDQQYLVPGVLLFIAGDEFFHGWAHHFAHARRPKSKLARRIQSFYKAAHRPHHFSGGNDNRGELNVTQTYVEGWGWALFLPNYALGLVVLYLGMYKIFLIGTVIKSVWALHNHCNWNYDLYLLNHPNPVVRRTMNALCHVLTFPTMHQQHHSRGKNSAKNMQNMLAVYDWLIWKTLVIEKQRPAVYGWRQSEKEERNVWYRFFYTSLKD